MVLLSNHSDFEPFKQIIKLISNVISKPFYLGGFQLSWLSIILYSLFGSLIIGAIVHVFKSHE